MGSKRALFYRRACALYRQRENLSPFDFIKNSQDIPSRYYFAFTAEEDKFNDFYGIAFALKQYAGLSNRDKINFHIEHGVFFDKSSYHGELNSPFKEILVTGDFRVSVLKDRYHRLARAIGPYIVYAKSSFSKAKIAEIKQSAGKTLTVFPVHSTKTVKYQYDFAQLIAEINKIKRKYNFLTVRVCLYYEDILRGDYREYEKAGFEIVSAGHVFDPMFLPRLRTIIELSDVTFSNALGTQLVYSLALKVPHFLKNQKLNCQDEAREISRETWDDYYKESKVTRAFSNFSEKILPDQKKVLEEYAGFKKILSPRELKKIIFIK